MFEGQGAQFCGMGRDIYDGFDEARRIFQEGNEATGISLEELCFETPADVLNQTKNAQLAVFAVSMSIFAVLKEKGIRPDYYAGFSLGECSALCAAGVFSLRDGFAIVKKRGELMQQCAEKTKGAMYAVIGLDDAVIEDICRRSDGYVEAVNYNCPSQLVIAGDESSAQNAADACKEAGALKVVRLAVNGAFHSAHMEWASKEFREFLKGFNFSLPGGGVYSNKSGGRLADFSDIPRYLSEHIVSPVLWKNEIRDMLAKNDTVFYEIGCEKTLTGFNRKISRDITTVNLSNAESIMNLTEV